jgi:hypothetical protein
MVQPLALVAALAVRLVPLHWLRVRVLQSCQVTVGWAELEVLGFHFPCRLPCALRGSLGAASTVEP